MIYGLVWTEWVGCGWGVVDVAKSIKSMEMVKSVAWEEVSRIW